MPASVLEYWELWFVWRSGRETMRELERWPYWRIMDAVELMIADFEYERKQAEKWQR